MSDDVKTNEEVKVEEANTEEVKAEETKAEETKVEETKEEAKVEEPKKEEVKEETTAEAGQEPEPTIELKGDAKKIMDLVKGLSAIELNQLVKALEEEFGVSAAAPMMMWGWGWWGDDGWWASDSMTVELAEVGQSKIAVIKAVKDILGVGLKEAKDLVGQAPVVIKEKVTADEAEKIKATLEENGATVAFK